MAKYMGKIHMEKMSPDHFDSFDLALLWITDSNPVLALNLTMRI